MHKDFSILSDDMADPPSFTVAGKTFTCLPNPPAGTLSDLIISADGKDIGKQAWALINLVEGCLPEGQDKEFRELIYSKTTVVPLEVLAQITEYIIEEYGKPRPTTPSSGSGAGSTETPATSEDGADSSVLTPVASDS